MKKIFILSFLFFSCTDNETATLLSDELSIEGSIEEGLFAKIHLTNSLPFNGVIDSLDIIKSIETKAKIVLSDGNTSEVLTLKKDESRFPFLFYRSNIIKGETNKQYDLSVTIRGKEFISKTTIPNKAIIQSTEFLKLVEDNSISSEFTDIKLTVENNTSENNYFKVLIKHINEDKFEFADPFIFSTENITTETFPLIIGLKTTDKDEINEENIILTNENKEIELRLIRITKEQFDFWKSIKGDETNILGDSSFSNEVISNISNGAFGYWSGENTINLKLKVPN